MWIDKNGDAFSGEEFPVVISTAVSCEKAEQGRGKPRLEDALDESTTSVRSNLASNALFG
jgi:hypothetical protein